VFEQKAVAVVVPCYNEEGQIAKVLGTMPGFVDRIIVVDDASSDATLEVVRQQAAAGDGNARIAVVQHERNRGVGAAIVSGYKEAIRERMDVVAVMAGDGQMDPAELHLVVGPVARGEADYAKGDRLFYEDAWHHTPKVRYLGNALLSMLTKIASGYWHVADSQTGYTAISRDALEKLALDAIYPRYGYPNDMLVRLNVYEMRVADVPVKPVYGVGERSKMRLWRVMPVMSWLIFKRFCWRMWHRYVIHDFHPLVLFYLAGGLLGAIGFGLFARMVWILVQTGRIPPINALVWGFCTVSALQFSLFAMWFDTEMSRDLNATTSLRRPARTGNGPPPGGELDTDRHAT